MPRVIITLYFHIRHLTGKKQVIAEGKTIEEVINYLITKEKAGKQIKSLLFEKEQLSSRYRIMLNGRNINLLNGLLTVVKENDEIAILPAIGGGKKKKAGITS